MSCTFQNFVVDVSGEMKRVVRVEQPDLATFNKPEFYLLVGELEGEKVLVHRVDLEEGPSPIIGFDVMLTPIWDKVVETNIVLPRSQMFNYHENVVHYSSIIGFW